MNSQCKVSLSECLSVLAWGVYFLATHQDVQEKVNKELKEKLGDDDVDHTNMGELT